MNRLTAQTFNPFKTASDPGGFQVRQRGATGLPAQPKAGPVVAPPDGTAFDLSSSLKALGLDPNMFGAGSDAVNQTAELNKQIKAVEDRLPDAQKRITDGIYPFAESQLMLNGRQAQTDTELAALALNPPVDQPSYQYTPDTQYPIREGLPVPQRPEAKVNPAASILAGIGGFIAPQGAAHFAASAIHGAVQKANQTYADSLRTRDMQLADLDRRHSDEVQARNEAIKFAEDNLDRKTRAEFLDAVGKRDYSLAISKLSGQRAADQIVSNGYGDLTASARQQAIAIANLQSLQQSKTDYENKKAGIAKGAQESQKLKVSLLESIARIKDSQAQHEASAQHNKDMEAINAQNHGFTMQPGQDGQPPSFIPIPKSGLSVKDQAKIDTDKIKADASAKNADTAAKNADSLAKYRQAQITNVLAGKKVDPSKLTVDQKIALEVMTGARQSLVTAQNKRATYMNENKGKKNIEKDPLYIARQKAEEDAAIQYQLAHKAAVESTGRKYLGKIKGYEDSAASPATLKAKSDAELFQMLGK